MKINPLMIFTGLALAALAGVLGLTRDRWYPADPQVTAAPGDPVAEATAPAKLAEPAPETTTAPESESPKPAEETALIAEPPKPAEPPTPIVEPPKPAEPAAPIVEPPKPAEQAAVIVEPPKPAAIAEPPAEAPETEAAVIQNQPETQQTGPIPLPDKAAETTPGFDTVRVAKTGEAVIAGRAEAGSEVTIKHNGKTIGTAIANSDGAFVVVPAEPLPAGNGALTLEAKASGDTVSKQASEAVAIAVPEQADDEVMVALISPDKPTKVLQKPENAAQPEPPAEAEIETAAVPPEAEPPAAEPVEQPPAEAVTKPISLDAVDYDEAGNIVFSGSANSGSAVRLYVDNQAVGEAQTGADGRWSFAGSAQISPGTHRLRVDELAAGGTVSSRVELPFFREEASKVALTAPEEPVQQIAEPAEQKVAAAAPEEPVQQTTVENTEPAEQEAAVAAPEQPEQQTTVEKTEPAEQEAAVAAPEQPVQTEPAQPEAATAAPEQPLPQTTVEKTEPAEPEVATAAPEEPVQQSTVEKTEPAQPEIAVAAPEQPEQQITVEKTEPAQQEVAAAAPEQPTQQTTVEKTEPAEQEIAVAAPEQPAQQTTVQKTEPAEPQAAPLPQPETSPAALDTELAAPQPPPENVAALAAAPAVVAPRHGRVIIQPGNNLWKLSRVIYGKGIKYTVIYEANKDNIRNPDLIYPGQIFTTPNAVPPEKIDPVRRRPLKPEEGGATAP